VPCCLLLLISQLLGFKVLVQRVRQRRLCRCFGWVLHEALLANAFSRLFVILVQTSLEGKDFGLEAVELRPHKVETSLSAFVGLLLHLEEERRSSFCILFLYRRLQVKCGLQLARLIPSLEFALLLQLGCVQ